MSFMTCLITLSRMSLKKLEFESLGSLKSSHDFRGVGMDVIGAYEMPKRLGK